MRGKDEFEKFYSEQEQREGMRAGIGKYFLHFSRYHRPWLAEIADRYKERGEFPALPTIILPSYYDDPNDKVVAAFASLLITDGVSMMEQVNDMRRLISDNPFRWFSEREYVLLSTGMLKDERLEGNYHCKYWMISSLMDYLWDMAESDGSISPSVIDEELPFSNEGNRSLLRLLLGSVEGFGLGVWQIDHSELKVPQTQKTRAFLRSWFPDWKNYGTFDESVRLFGFEKDYDFYYAYLGYLELREAHPKEFDHHARLYTRRYNNGTRTHAFVWRKEIPEISF